MLKWLALLVTCVTLNAALSGDIRRLPPGPPAIPVKASLTNAQTAIRAIVVPGVARAVQSGGELTESIAIYFRGIAGVFCGMSTNANFSAEYLETEVNRIMGPPEGGNYYVEVKTSIVSAYKLAYADRTRAELPPLEWLERISESFCAAIKQGIRDGGRANLAE